MSKARQPVGPDPAATMEPIGSLQPHPRNPRKNDEAVPRVARCIELDPIYCDVIRRRWTRYAKEHGLDPGTGALDG